MKAITLTEPWAKLVERGRKRIETRSWRTHYRGPIAIHAAQGFPSWARSLCFEDVFYQELFDRTVMDDILAGWGLEVPVPAIPRHVARVAALPRGAVLATARLAGCEPTDSAFTGDTLARRGARHEREFGDYSPGRWMWLLEDIDPLPTPVPARGSLSLWEWSPPTLRRPSLEVESHGKAAR